MCWISSSIPMSPLPTFSQTPPMCPQTSSNSHRTWVWALSPPGSREHAMVGTGDWVILLPANEEHAAWHVRHLQPEARLDLLGTLDWQDSLVARVHLISSSWPVLEPASLLTLARVCIPVPMRLWFCCCCCCYFVWNDCIFFLHIGIVQLGFHKGLIIISRT